MKKVFKFIFAIIEIALLTVLVLFFAVESIQEKLVAYYKYLICAFAVVSTMWIVSFCVSLYKKEIGETVEGKIKYKKDKERKQEEPVAENNAVDVYSNFERAEFTSKIKDSYQKEVYAFPTNMPKVEEKVEEKPEEIVQPIVEEPKVEEPVVEEVKPVEPAKEVKVLKQVDFPIWDGNVVKVAEGWSEFLNKETGKSAVKANIDGIKNIYESGAVVYPAKENIFKPFEFAGIEDVHVVILGKIPYYRKNQADGFAYSTAVGADMNQSTEVIIKEAMDDVKIAQPANGSLEKWAKQGVLLLNTVLTAPSNKPAAHTEMWKQFTEDTIKEIVKNPTPKVFVLWGEFAKEYLPLLNKKHILVLEAANPSPLSAQSGFYGSKPFSKINEFLEKNGIEKINWEL